MEYLLKSFLKIFQWPVDSDIVTGCHNFEIFSFSPILAHELNGSGSFSFFSQGKSSTCGYKQQTFLFLTLKINCIPCPLLLQEGSQFVI
jgi:hypothetical protein